MKATLRRNGRHMVTIRAAHHLDGVDIAQTILIHQASGYGVPEVGEGWTRRGIEQFIRRVLSDHGDGATCADDWREAYEGYSDLSLGKAVAWAASLVRQHFPDLAGEALNAWERGEVEDE